MVGSMRGFLVHLLTFCREMSDTTKSGQLLFPEFALAMYLCNLRLVGKPLPTSLPERAKNEVSSMVDIISFGVPDDKPLPTPRTNAPDFNRSSAASPSAPLQPQAQLPSNSQLLSQLVSQPTGMMPQITGFPGPQGNFAQQQQQQGLTPQMTAFPGGQAGPQATGYNGPRPPMPPMPTGFGGQSQLSPQQTGMPIAPLNAQPTGAPGQWGLVNAPSTGLPNIDALRQRMMPQSGREGGYTTAGLSGNATVPWAVTKDEKKIYDDLFKSWDGFGKGFIGGDQAIEIFGQSGLPKPDLERIWTLSDPTNRGRLNLDEFAVAMHLIYRKLNGYPVPNRLPPELVPPSTRNFADSIGSVKSALSRDAEVRKQTGAFLQPQATGVSYLKTHSFRGGSPLSDSGGRKDATVFRNNDDDIGYKSSARRRVGAGGRTPSPQLDKPKSDEELSLDQLQKRIREKQVLLDAMDFQDEKNMDEDEALDRKDRREAEDLYRRIRRVQEDIDANPDSIYQSSDGDAERRQLKRQLQGLTDKLPELASNVRKTERAIADAQLELFRLKEAKANPNSANNIVGTGPGGAITESDRLKARAKAMMQQRSAALTGKAAPPGADDGASARKLEEESARVRNERENNERMVRDVEDSVTEYGRSLESNLKEGGESAEQEHERRRWHDALGVEDEVRDFIFDMQRSSRANRTRREEDARPANGSAYARSEQPKPTPEPRVETPVERSANATPTSGGASYSSFKTAEDRAAFIKQQAEQRMAERLAALGIRAPVKASGETPHQRIEREKAEREEKVRQAEAEDAKREEERQRRLADEGLAPPVAAKGAGKKPPPAPPSRSARTQSIGQQETREFEAEKKRVDEEMAAKALREQQEQQEKETQAIAYVIPLAF